MLRAVATQTNLVSKLAGSNTAATAPADTNENILATITIPAGALGTNGSVLVTAAWTMTNNANTKALRIRYSGISGTSYFGAVLDNIAGAVTTAYIGNRNSTNSQTGYGVLNSPAGSALAAPGVTSAVDTTATTTIVITAQKADAGDTVTLDSYTVEFFPS